MHKLTLVLSLVGFAPVASAQDVVIIIEDASGVAAPAPTEAPDAQPAPSRAAPTPAQPAAGPAAPTVALSATLGATVPTHATPRVGYGLQLRAPEAIALEIERLRAERPSLWGPITLMHGMALTTGMSAFLASLWTFDCDDDHCGRNPGTIVFSALSTAGFALFVTGLVTLVRRAKQRRRINRRIRELELASGPAPAW